MSVSVFVLECEFGRTSRRDIANSAVDAYHTLDDQTLDTRLDCFVLIRLNLGAVLLRNSQIAFSAFAIINNDNQLITNSHDHLLNKSLQETYVSDEDCIIEHIKCTYDITTQDINAK